MDQTRYPCYCLAGLLVGSMTSLVAPARVTRRWIRGLPRPEDPGGRCGSSPHSSIEGSQTPRGTNRRPESLGPATNQGYSLTGLLRPPRRGGRHPCVEPGPSFPEDGCAKGDMDQANRQSLPSHFLSFPCLRSPRVFARVSQFVFDVWLFRTNSKPCSLPTH